MNVSEVLGRRDYAIISQLIPEGARVLDLGCGDGALLAWLKVNKRVEARGVELSRDLVQVAIARGVTVYQGDLEASLADYPDQAFDFVILSQTVQETRHPLVVLKEMLRIGRHAIVAFPNFGHWRVGLNHLLSGRAPKTGLFPFEWYDSPNIHFLTVIDFEELVAKQGWQVDRRLFLSGPSVVTALPNWRAEIAIYLFHGPA
ncbi:MAG TPA: methionine biosynthesis protein MetW [Paludibaculum sp.]